MRPTLLFTALAIAAPALKDPPAPAGIECHWVLESRIVGGQPDVQAKAVTSSRCIVTRDKWVIDQPMGQPLEWVLELDSAARPPALTLYKADDKARGEPGLTGIYRLEGDTLTICYVFKGPRPTDFVSPAGTEHRLMTLRRGRAKKKPIRSSCRNAWRALAE